MENHQSHQIDQLAQQVMQNALPVAWVINPFIRDYGKDFHVELADSRSRLTGTSFLVQLKGQKRVTKDRDKQFALFSLTTKHAAYYLDKIKDIPLFLFIVDVSAREGWWLHVQPALKQLKGWRAKRTVRLKIPLANRLADADRLSAAVTKAQKEMRLSNFSITDAIAAEIDRVRRIDPRFDAKAQIDDKGRMHLRLRANEVVNISMHALKNAKSVHERLKEMLGKGTAVNFEPGELRLVGTQLFADIEECGGQLSAQISSPGSILIEGKSATGEQSTCLEKTYGELSGGFEQAFFKAEWPQSVLRLNLGPLAPGVGGGIELKLSYRVWEGQHLLSLSYFEQLYRTFTALQDAVELKVLIEVAGNHGCSLVLPNKLAESTKEFAEFLALVNKARKVCAHHNVSPTWDIDQLDEDWDFHVEQLYAVQTAGIFRQKTPRMTLTTNLVKSTVDWHALKCEKPAPLRLVGNTTYKIFDKEIVLLMAHEYSHVLIDQITENEDTVTVSFVGTDETETILRLASDEEGESLAQKQQPSMLKLGTPNDA